MSKCDIRIEFDRDDRTYRGGETVSGTARIRVNKDLTCNGIKLTHYWKTHGRGNTDSGDKYEQVLVESCQLRDGETFELPFSFVAECHPITYRGHFINVDHYVRVDVDVPWAFDPKMEEEFIVLPGARPPHMTGRRDEIVDFKKAATEVTSTGGKIVVYLIIAVVLLVFSFFAIMLVPFLIAGGLIYWIWKQMIKSRVGEVELKTRHVVLSPGEAWPLELAFEPRKSFSVNGITIKLQGRESATSGSGTNKTTHLHTFFEEVHMLHPAGMIPGGEPIVKQAHIVLPETVAYSFDGGDNEVEWSAEVRIDMPLFPDWKERKVFQIVPLEFLHDGDGTPDPEQQPYADHPESPAADSPSDRSLESIDAEAEMSGTGELVDTDSGLPGIVPLLMEIADAGQFGREQRDIAKDAEGQVFDVTVEIDRLVSTFGSQAGADYRNGKTINGTVAGTDQTVQIFTRDNASPLVERLSRGDQWRTAAAVHGWDSLYNRLLPYRGRRRCRLNASGRMALTAPRVTLRSARGSARLRSRPTAPKAIREQRNVTTIHRRSGRDCAAGLDVNDPPTCHGA